MCADYDVDREIEVIGEIADEVMDEVHREYGTDQAFDRVSLPDDGAEDAVRQERPGLSYALVGIPEGRFTARCGFCGLRVRHGAQYGITARCPRCRAWFSKGECEAEKFTGSAHLWGVCRYCVGETLESLMRARRR